MLVMGNTAKRVPIWKTYYIYVTDSNSRLKRSCHFKIEIELSTPRKSAIVTNYCGEKSF